MSVNAESFEVSSSAYEAPQDIQFEAEVVEIPRRPNPLSKLSAEAINSYLGFLNTGVKTYEITPPNTDNVANLF